MKKKNMNKKCEDTICNSGGFVEVKIDINKNGSILIHCQAYIKKILRQFNFEDCNLDSHSIDLM